MPARPIMQDEIEGKLKGAITRDVVSPSCCFKTCKRSADVLLVLRYADQSTDVFALCAQDFAKIKANHPSTLDKTVRQGVFLYS